MKKKVFQLVLSVVIFMILGVPVFGQSIKIVADDFPPLNYLDEAGNVTGFSTEVVRAVLKELDIDAEIKIYPWARAYNMALKEENVLIYTIGRNPKREELFKWVGLLSEDNACFFVLKDRADIQVNTLDDARQYRVGGVREDIRTQHLLSLGFENLELVPQNVQNLKKLVAKRIDLWLENELTGYYLIKKHGYSSDDFNVAYTFQVGSGGYMAFSRATSDELVEQFRNALEKIKEDGTYDKIIATYR